jgi:hypothetical protein
MRFAPSARLLILAFWAAAALVLVMALLPAPPRAPIGDKAQHMVAFAVLASLASNAYFRSSLVKIGVGLAAFGAVIELLQAIPALGRNASAMDWAADCAALAVVLLVTHFRN